MGKELAALKAQPAPVQEPVAYTTGHCIEKAKPRGCQLHNLHCRYPACDRKTAATPPAAQRQWVGLTDDEIRKLAKENIFVLNAIIATSAKLKEKNESHRQHVTDGSPCWCEPETSYTDPETGASVIVHKEPQ
jgi:hypothetical protein